MELILLDGPFGDCTSNYKVVVKEDQITLGEFLNKVYDENLNKFGSIRMYDGRDIACDITFDVTEEIPTLPEKLHSTIINKDKIRANGGWGSMSYSVHVYKGEEEDPYRKTGRTTRIVNRCIEELFVNGYTIVKDHHDSMNSHRLVANTIAERVKAEHGVDVIISRNLGAYMVKLRKYAE